MNLTTDEIQERLHKKGYLDLSVSKDIDLVAEINRLKKRSIASNSGPLLSRTRNSRTC